MKKLSITLLLIVAMLFTFTACDEGTSLTNGVGSLVVKYEAKKVKNNAELSLGGLVRFDVCKTILFVDSDTPYTIEITANTASDCDIDYRVNGSLKSFSFIENDIEDLTQLFDVKCESKYFTINVAYSNIIQFLQAAYPGKTIQVPVLADELFFNLVVTATELNQSVTVLFGFNGVSVEGIELDTDEIIFGG